MSKPSTSKMRFAPQPHESEGGEPRQARPNLLKPAQVLVDTHAYEWAHGKAPRGQGTWAFHRDRSVDASSPEIIWEQGTYADAKRAAQHIAAGRGWSRITVLS